MADTPTPIDPQLTGETQPRAQSVTLPTRTLDDVDGGSDGEGNEGGEKRRKLNLLKCKQCREARKKCFPADRSWPQKCDRCLQHRPEPLECSPPEMNTRKRGPNLSKEKDKPKEREREKDKDKDKDPKPLRRSKTASTTSDKQEPRSRGSSDDDEDAGGSSDDASVFNRPVRNLGPIGIKREHPRSPAPEPPPSDNDETHRPASAYLPLAEGEFRVLQLDPGRKEDQVTCSFITASMESPPEYEAISYVWGTMHQKSMYIRLRDPRGKTHPIKTKSNLYYALRSLRHPKDTRSFWVDALCINHSMHNNEERNKQTRMKRYVFRNAVNLCFWLGEDEIYKAALKFIPRILDLTKIDELVRDKSTVDDWAGFVTLLNNSVFSRLWLVQEVAVARNVTLHCGQPAIHYGDLVDAVAIFMSFRTEISLLFRSKGKSYKELTDRKVTMAKRFIDVSTNALRVISGKTQRLLSLEALVSHLIDLSSSDDLDRIYSVLAIAKDGVLQIDYNLSVLEVYQDFVTHAIESSQSLDIICRPWASSAQETLPTWVRPLQPSLQAPVNSNSSERINPDSLVGLPDHKYYDASRGTVPTCRVELINPSFKESKSLSVKGRCLDTIARLGPRASEGVIPCEWLNLSDCIKKLKEAAAAEVSPPEDFWRTLVADRGPNGSIPPSWYTRAFLHCMQHLTPTGDINTNRLIASEEESTLVVDFLQRVQSVTWNRKFLISEKKEWIGLAPMAAQKGDLICILYGCSVPVVLRQVGAVDGETYFQLVGECYVHGIMDGEAIEAAREYREHEFGLR